MLGAIIGDIAGSVYEWNNIKTKAFPFLGPGCAFTDDTVMTLAVASACLHYRKSKNIGVFQPELVSEMQRLGRRYPDRGYGARFYSWLMSDHPQPYKSFGNGSAMRVSPVAYAARTLGEAELLAKASGRDDPQPSGRDPRRASRRRRHFPRAAGRLQERDQILCGSALLSAVLYAGRDPARVFLRCNLSGQRPAGNYGVSREHRFEDAVRNAISIGGDSDTIACIAGAIAEAHYGIPDEIKSKVSPLLARDPIFEIYEKFNAAFPA